MSCNIASEMATWTPLGDQNPMVGYRFRPTDRDLIIDYLEPKLKGVGGDDPIIGVADVYKIEPWDLPVRSKIDSKDKVWYFFCSRQQNFTKCKRFNRTTEKGYWKSDGKPRPIKATRTQKVIGTKRTLIFHIGPSKGIRTKWVMHEYECIPELKVARQGDFILCKLKYKSDEKYGRDDANHQVAISDSVNSLCEKLDGMTCMSSHEIGEQSHLIYDSGDKN